MTREGGLTPMTRQTHPDIDPGIFLPTQLLWNEGIYTYESCDGSPGHSRPEPTIWFHGGKEQGLLAVHILMTVDCPVLKLNRQWVVYNNELDGPTWCVTFRPERLLAWRAERGDMRGLLTMEAWMDAYRTDPPLDSTKVCLS